jgi:hypothetical protein
MGKSQGWTPAFEAVGAWLESRAAGRNTMQTQIASPNFKNGLPTTSSKSRS